jgi:hypothetical protein
MNEVKREKERGKEVKREKERGKRERKEKCHKMFGDRKR